MNSVLLFSDNSKLQEAIQNAASENEIRFFSAAGADNVRDILKGNQIDSIIFDHKSADKSAIDDLSETLRKESDLFMIHLLDNKKNNRDTLFDQGITDYFSASTKPNTIISYIKSLFILQNKILSNKTFQYAFFSTDKDDDMLVDILSDIVPNKLHVLKSEKELEKSKHKVDFFFYKSANDCGAAVNHIHIIKKHHPQATILVFHSDCGESVISALYSAGIDNDISLPFSLELLMGKTYSVQEKLILSKSIVAKESELSQVAIMDSLTGLHNQIYMYDILKREIEHHKRYDVALSLILIDIDNFRTINDTLGMTKGNEVLQGVSNIIKRLVRKADIVGRYGGEKFLLILPQTEIEPAYGAAERIRNDVEKYFWDKGNLIITISGSVVELEDQDADTIVEKASDLLSNAKMKGKNRIEVEFSQ